MWLYNTEGFINQELAHPREVSHCVYNQAISKVVLFEKGKELLYSLNVVWNTVQRSVLANPEAKTFPSLLIVKDNQTYASRAHYVLADVDVQQAKS